MRAARWAAWVWALVLVAGAVGVRSVAAQEAPAAQAPAEQAPADTAMVLIKLAPALESAGDRELAEELYRLVVDRYPGTSAAALATERLAALGSVRHQGSGRVGFVVYNTLFGTWLGIATPLALGVEDQSAAFGAGLLSGGTLGLVGSSSYSGRHPLSRGQASAYTLSTLWMTWQAMGWREVLDIGRKRACWGEQYARWCGYTTPDEAPWVAAVVGGVTGAATGVVLSRLPLQLGDVELVQHAGLWGTYFGAAAYVLTHDSSDDDALLTFLLVGGDALGAAAIPAARAWKPTEGQVRLTSIAGVAGGVAGLGADLLLDVNDEDMAILIPTVGATAGLVAGAAMTRLLAGPGQTRAEAAAAPDLALLNVRDKVRLGLPWPQLAVVPAPGRDGRTHARPGLRLGLLDARF